jgi:hypothetical protein
MIDRFQSYINFGKSLADAKNLSWIIKLDVNGKAEIGWNLTKLVSGYPAKNFYLRNFAANCKVLDFINTDEFIICNQPIDVDWQELIKAATCEQLLYKKNSLSNVSNNIIPALNVIATCCLEKNVKPWELTSDTVNKAITIAKSIQKCGKLADTIVGVTKCVIDVNLISRSCPIYPTLLITRLVPKDSGTKSRLIKTKEELLDSLNKRKSQSKLPEQRAFWELIRIIFTEKPKSFTDLLRFASLKVLIITGLRIGEVVRLPHDWKREREFYDISGKSAGEMGGISSALSLRHFAEKQGTADSSSVELYENIQFVPKIFEKLLTDTLDEVARVTMPLRRTLKLQCETDRILPWYSLSDNVSVTEIYTRLSGNPFWLNIEPKQRDAFIEQYREKFDNNVLYEIDSFLSREYQSGNIKQLNHSMYTFFNRLTQNETVKNFNFVNKDGSLYQSNSKHFKWKDVYVNIRDLEDYLRENVPTKLSDKTPIKLTSGEINPWELMFLLPKRALAEERNDGIMDLNRYHAVSIPDSLFLMVALGENKKGESIFKRYGETDLDKKLTLISKSLRHLQNSELFRLGIADTIISKRFNRRSVVQSYEYDHRSLSESLNAIELPLDVEIELGEKSATVAKLIKSGKASGAIVENYKKIQLEQGDQAAFDYLRIEADGFHATPYGHCINSFTVEPCPKNLECFAGCRHLTATNLPEHIKNLETLANKYESALSDLTARPKGTIGHENQLAHATIRLESIRKLLKTSTGSPAFPDGADFSKSHTSKSVLDD